jgi:RHS repeat-associated protein
MTSSTGSGCNGSSNGYDCLNRLTTAQNTATTSTSRQYAGKYLCWAYDPFGNRTVQSQQSSACPAQSASTLIYNANNQVSGVIPPGGGPVSPSPYTYDPSGDGDIIADMTSGNQYLYDGEGRICAVLSPSPAGGPIMTGYIYDADGTRVAKGSIQNMNTCNPAPVSQGGNGFQTTSDYVLGLGGEQVTEMGMDANGNMAHQHTNVWAGGKLLATYDDNGLHFYLDDPLGTRRVQTDYAGVVEQSCTSLPYGDGESCTPTPTEHLFTGKERDTESGNDYFGARYYASTTGRFLSPDWAAQVEPVPYATISNPQSLNLYVYVGNNPLTGTDPNGHSTNPGGSGPGETPTAGNFFDGQNTLFPNLDAIGDPLAALWYQQQAQQQDSSSGGKGFWSGLKQGFSNLLHGHSWNYVKTSVSAFIARTWDANDPNVTVVNDAVGAAAVVAPKISKELGVPYLSTAVSLWNDHSLLNLTENGLGFTEAGPGMVGLSLLIDGAQMVDPTGPDENMPWNFSIPKEPVPSGLDTYSGPSDSSGGLDW